MLRKLQVEILSSKTYWMDDCFEFKEWCITDTNFDYSDEASQSLGLVLPQDRMSYYSRGNIEFREGKAS